MNGIEFLNLESFRDLNRIERELNRQARLQPLDQALAVYRLCRPEIAEFVRKNPQTRARMSQARIDMNMARLLLKEPGEETALEAQPILVEAAKLLHDFLKECEDPNIWRMLAEAFHMQVICGQQLQMPSLAEAYCIAMHRAIRGMAKFSQYPINREDEKELLYQMYQHTDEVFSNHKDPLKRIQGLQARMRLRSHQRWQGEQEQREAQANLATTLYQLARTYHYTLPPRDITRAMAYYNKALAITRSNMKHWAMRRLLVDIWHSMGELMMLEGDEQSLLKAKDYFVNALDAAKSYHQDCLRREDDTTRARANMLACYLALAQVCDKLPGVKNAQKMLKYLRLAEQWKL